jgi:hypothetical protein
MPVSAAADAFQMHRVFHSANCPRRVTRIARFIRALKNTEPLPTVLEHFGHEWQVLEASTAVECCENLFPAPDFYPFAGPQIERLILV